MWSWLESLRHQSGTGKGKVQRVNPVSAMTCFGGCCCRRLGVAFWDETLHPQGISGAHKQGISKLATVIVGASDRRRFSAAADEMPPLHRQKPTRSRHSGPTRRVKGGRGLGHYVSLSASEHQPCLSRGRAHSKSPWVRSAHEYGFWITSTRNELPRHR